jgi:8-oxo-dGTP pyrophosphatase MutT (NUDIX family)
MVEVHAYRRALLAALNHCAEPSLLYGTDGGRWRQTPGSGKRGSGNAGRSDNRTLANRWYAGTRMSIRTLNSREVYRNPWLRLREDEIERSNGARGIYGVVDKDDCAVIIPIEGDTIYLVEQFRYTIQQRCLELPQGGWETADVNPEELARGELREETGLIAARMTLLGNLWIAYGFARQKQYVYLATGLTLAERDPDPEENDLVVRTATVAEFEQMLLDGTIQDSTTLAAWGLYRVWRDSQLKR